MPRKAKDRPEGSLHIEGLSDGREMRPSEFVDDFTGEHVPVVQDQSPARSMEPAQAIVEREQRARAKAKLALLERVGLAQAQGETMVMPRVQGMNTIPIKIAGETKALLVPRPSWRRV